MAPLEISWRGLEKADYEHLDATAAWGAFVGDELVFVVVEGTAEADDLDDVDDLEEGPVAEVERVYTTWVVLTSEEDGMDGLEPLDGFQSLTEAQESVAADLKDWQRMRQNS